MPATPTCIEASFSRSFPAGAFFFGRRALQEAALFSPLESHPSRHPPTHPWLLFHHRCDPLPPSPARVVDLGAAPGGWSMVAARIVHARGPRNSQQRGGGGGRAGRGGGGRAGGAPPQLPPPLPEGRVEAAEKRERGSRGGAVVAVDLLDLEADLPGVEASGSGRGGGTSIFRVLGTLGISYHFISITSYHGVAFCQHFGYSLCCFPDGDFVLSLGDCSLPLPTVFFSTPSQYR